ncbi:MAG: hypothetical protein C0501_09245 [Isosphaera sp.]|nr:hypothetical protein [Isosphaera sp.]
MPTVRKVQAKVPVPKSKPRPPKPGKKPAKKGASKWVVIRDVLAGKAALPAGASVALPSRVGGLGASRGTLVGVVPADVRERAKELRARLARKPGVGEVLTPGELADAAPFYFQLQACIRQLREARLAAGLTLAQVAERTGLAAETLSRLETGMLTNPTWKTLGVYAAAVGRKLTLSALV